MSTKAIPPSVSPNGNDPYSHLREEKESKLRTAEKEYVVAYNQLCLRPQVQLYALQFATSTNPKEYVTQSPFFTEELQIIRKEYNEKCRWIHDQYYEKLKTFRNQMLELSKGSL